MQAGGEDICLLCEEYRTWNLETKYVKMDLLYICTRIYQDILSLLRPDSP